MQIINQYVNVILTKEKHIACSGLRNMSGFASKLLITCI